VGTADPPGPTTSPVDAAEAAAEPDQPASAEPKRPRNADYVQSLERGLAVIRAFGPDRTHLTLSDVARETSLTRAAARRFLLTLVELGYIDFDGRLFSLRPRVLELGYSYMSTLSFSEIALPAMRDLVDKTSVSVSMSVLDGDDAVYIAHVSAKRILAITVSVGTRVPAYATALGQVLLASMPDAEVKDYLARQEFEAFTPNTVVDRDELVELLETVRVQGYAFGDEGLELGLRTIAVPVTDARGVAVAGLGVSTQANSATRDVMRREYLPALLATAEQISAHLRNATSPVPH
jgi:IclR family pca regulon transcriptional regulator